MPKAKEKSTRRVQVYRVQHMYEYDVEASDDVSAMAEALNRARAEHLPGVVADCHFVAVVTAGARRDVYGKVPS